MSPEQQIWRPVFWVAVALLMAWRFLYFGEQIDEPHSWRQYDTAHYISAFYHEGIDLLHPKVNWLGGHKVLILEFPLPEAIAAVFYKAFGPSILWARLVTWLFFVGAVLYFHFILRHVLTESVARLATLIYLCLPLGLAYSRAVHIDYAAIFFCHAAVYHVLAGLSGRGRKHLWLASGFATLGFLVKVPYLFYMVIPIGYWMYRQGQVRQVWRLLPYALPPVLALGIWQWHVKQVNAAAPDWFFIPEYRKFVDMRGWYYGTFSSRFMPQLWATLAGRLKYDVAGGWLAFYPALAGFLLFWRQPGVNFMRFWLLGTVIYMLIFFPLNVIHNYYQLPFLAPVAVFIALSADWLLKELGKLDMRVRAVGTLCVLLLFVLNGDRLLNARGLKGEEAEHFKNYLRVDPYLVAYGQALRPALPPDALVICSYGGLDCRAPHLMYEAGHYGWSIKTKFLNRALIERLRSEGAGYLAVLAEDGFAPAWADSMPQYPRDTLPLALAPELLRKHIYLWDLR